MSQKRFVARFGLDNNNNTITNVALPVNSTDVVPKSVTDNLSTVLQSAYNTANTGYQFITSGGNVTGNVSINGNLNITGNITYTGNVTTQIITGNTGEFFGTSTSGYNALYAGIPTGYTFEPQTVVQVTANYNGYSQLNHQNINKGSNSSMDVVCTADNGTANDTYIDLGINSSTYSQTGFTLNNPNDGYLYVYGNTATGGGNLIVATMTNNDIIFATNGQNTGNEQGRFKNGIGLILKQTTPSINTSSGALQVSGGAGISGNVYAGTFYGAGTGLTGTASSLSIGGTAYNITSYTINQNLGTNNSPTFANTTVTSLGVGTAPSANTGEIRATNNITAYYSDENLKTRLGNIENALEKLMMISGFYYEANETAQALGYHKRREVGVSAQEVQAILPEIVVPAPIDEKYLTVHYERLVPLLIEAIKEQQKQIDDLRSKLGTN